MLLTPREGQGHQEVKEPVVLYFFFHRIPKDPRRVQKKKQQEKENFAGHKMHPEHTLTDRPLPDLILTRFDCTMIAQTSPLRPFLRGAHPSANPLMDQARNFTRVW